LKISGIGPVFFITHGESMRVFRANLSTQPAIRQIVLRKSFGAVDKPLLFKRNKWKYYCST
jgi:FMN phosphatase YigB (HAD superfamily)